MMSDSRQQLKLEEAVDWTVVTEKYLSLNKIDISSDDDKE